MGDIMKFRLGYVGMPLTLLDTYCHTITYTNYKKLSDELKFQKLDDIIYRNLLNLEKVIDYNISNNIFFYRLTHSFLPLMTIEENHYNYDKFEEIWFRIGKKIRDNNMRIDTHPDQFCLLNSKKDGVLENSINILKMNLFIFKKLGIPGKCILHIGCGKENKAESILLFKKNFLALPLELQELIVLENDDTVYTVTDVLNICLDLHIPMVLDYHHYNCHHLKNEKIKDLLPNICMTWNNTGLNPKVHFSSPKSLKEKRTHDFYIDYSHFIRFWNLLNEVFQEVDIMLECKGKDEALFRLCRQIVFYKEIALISGF